MRSICSNFNEKVDIIQLDAFGRYSCLLHEKIQEECPINDFRKFEFKCSVHSQWFEDDVFSTGDRSEGETKSEDGLTIKRARFLKPEAQHRKRTERVVF